MVMILYRKLNTSTNCLLQLYATVKYCKGLSTRAAVKSRATSKSKPDLLKGLHSSEFNKKEEYLLKEKLLRGNESAQNQRNHVFKQLFPWKTKASFVEDLKKSEVYNKDGLIVLCKPYGISQAKVNKKSTGVQTLVWGGVPKGVPCLEDVLPVLQEHYKAKQLEIIRSAERWNSGLLLLSTSKEMGSRVAKCLRRSKAAVDPPLSFLVVTDGKPNPTEGKSKVAIGLKYIQDVGKVPIIKKNYTKAEISRGESKLAAVNYATLAHNPFTQASLVEVNIQTLKWHFLRVWLSSISCPVLGDPLYGGRVKAVLGKRVQISPHNLAAHQPQDISGKILEQLKLPENEKGAIPSLIHFSKMTLSQFYTDKTDLVLTAPPPAHFTWACEKMQLMSAAEMKILQDGSDKH